MKKTIKITRPDGSSQDYTTFKKAVITEGLSYHYLKRFSLPVEHKGYKIEKKQVL